MKTRFKLRTINSYDNTFVRKSDSFSKKDIIDRTGYIPLELQLQRLKVQGQNVSELVDHNFGYEFKEMQEAWEGKKSIDELTSSTLLKERFMDKNRVDDLYKTKLSKYVNVKNQHEELERLKIEYEKNKELHRIKQEAINEYIANERVNNSPKS